MKHPFINNIDDLSIEDLQNKLTDLHNKITFAYRTGNGALIHQLNMAIESYREAYNKKIDSVFDKNKTQTKIQITKI